jgi:hypothetical protein
MNEINHVINLTHTDPGGKVLCGTVKVLKTVLCEAWDSVLCIYLVESKVNTICIAAGQILKGK